MRAHWPTMGTVASVHSVEPVPDAVLAAVRGALAETDSRFSLYRQDSELSRIARGELALEDAGIAVRDAYAEALAWRQRTDGAFTAHRPDGVVDLSGLVKATAMHDSAMLLDASGVSTWTLGVGGDLVRASGPHPAALGIVDPDARTRLFTAVRLGDHRRALATSGSAERGEHIWTRTDLPRSPFAQVSVAADDIVTADVLATAIVAGGQPMLELACDRWDIDVLAVGREGELHATPGMRAAIAAAAA